MWESIVSAVVPSLVGAFFGKDEPAAPTQADMQTWLQKNLDPELWKIAQNYIPQISAAAIRQAASQKLANDPNVGMEKLKATESIKRDYGTLYQDRETSDKIVKYYKEYETANAKDPKSVKSFQEYMDSKEPGLVKKITGEYHGENGKLIDSTNMANYAQRYGSVSMYRDITDFMPTSDTVNTPDLFRKAIATADAQSQQIAPAPQINESADTGKIRKEIDDLLASTKGDTTAAEGVKNIDKTNAQTQANYDKYAAMELELVDKLKKTGELTPDEQEVLALLKDRSQMTYGSKLMKEYLDPQLAVLRDEKATMSAGIMNEFAGRGFNQSTAGITDGLIPLEGKYALAAGNLTGQAAQYGDEAVRDAIQKRLELNSNAVGRGLAGNQAAGQIIGGLQTNNLQLQSGLNSSEETKNALMALDQTRRQSALGLLNQVAEADQARQLTNIQLQDAYRLRQKAEEQQQFENIMAMYGGQSGISNNMAQSADAAYTRATANVDKYNKNLVDTSASLASAISGLNKPKTGITATTYTAQSFTPTWTTAGAIKSTKTGFDPNATKLTLKD